MEHALKIKVKTGSAEARLTAQNCHVFLTHAVELAKKARPEVPTASAIRDLIDLLDPEGSIHPLDL
jgi:hypothetical protein